MIVAFRTDASLQIGSGHVMRCLTLADELKKAGAKITFITRDHPGNLNQLIKNKGHNLEVLSPPSISDDFQADSVNPRSEYLKWLGVPELRDASETIAKLKKNKPSWLIVDHYGLGLEWELALRPHIEKLMVIDDLADRKHDCDFLLDQNFYLLLDQNFYQNGQNRYDDLVPPACTKFLGPEFALLRPEFAEARKKIKPRTGEIKRVFVFFGGSDRDNVTAKALEALSHPDLMHLEVDGVIGESNPHKGEIEVLVKTRSNTFLHVQVENMAELMARADLALGAGGSTTWERLCLGLPSLVISIAANQTPTNQALMEAGYITFLGARDKVEVGDIVSALRHCLTHPEELMLQSIEMQKLVPGTGAAQMAKTIFSQSINHVLTPAY